MTNKKNVLLQIYGCGGHAKSVADVAIANGNYQIEFIDPHAKDSETLFGFPVLTKPSRDKNVKAIIAIGDNQKREQLFLSFKQLTLVTLTARDAYIGNDAQIEPGVFIGHGAYVGPHTFVKANTIINTHCVVEHDCVIGKHTHISINATVAGKCKIGDKVMVGAAATIIHNISICNNVVIGAGAVVVKDIHQPGTYVGVPVKRIGGS